MSIAVRPADLADRSEHSDRHFVVHSWVSSFKDSDSSGLIQIEDWYRVMIPQVGKALARPDVRTLMAYDTADPSQLYGFVVADTEENPPLVYYVYTKGPYRRGGRGRIWEGAGVARQLFEAIGIDPAKPFRYACSTRFVGILERKIPMADFQPELGRFPKKERRRR